MSRVELGKAVKNVNVNNTTQNENINPQIPINTKKNTDLFNTDKITTVNVLHASTTTFPKKNISIVPGRLGRPSGIFPASLKRANSNMTQPTIIENTSNDNISKKMKLVKRSNSAGTWR